MAYRGDDLTVLIFGDTALGLDVARNAALAQGARVVAALPIAEAPARLDSQVYVDLVMIDVHEDHGPLLDGLFGELEGAARQGRFASIVTIASHLVDVATACLDHENVVMLVGRDREALSRALANMVLRAQAEPQLREGGDHGEPHLDDSPYPRMRRSNDHNATIDGGRIDISSIPAGLAALADQGSVPDAAALRGIIRARRLRNQFFGPALFADPAWDMLLDLMVARIEGRSVAVSSLCIAAGVPATTALRWIKQLTSIGLLRRVADPGDGRRIFIELTDEAVNSMRDYFSALVDDR